MPVSSQNAICVALTNQDYHGSLSGVIVAEQRVQDSDDRVFPVRWPRLATEVLAVAAIAWGMVAYMYRVWAAPWSMPWTHGGDSLFNLGTIKALTQGDWIYENPRLGAPYSQQMYDFPFG